MKIMTVTYAVDDRDYARLENLAESYKALGANFTPGQVFSHIMTKGFYPDFRERVAFEERKLRTQNEKELTIGG